MPIYEFYCPDNHKIYSFLARSISLAGTTPRCPDDPKFRLERMVSSFAVTGRAKEKPELPPGSGPDDARMEAAMAEMEREFSGMDSENPDPRQLAQMMRKMSSLTGEKMPGQMEEMIRRMEAGEDPEKLEAEYGDAMDGPDGELGEAAGDETGDGLKARLAALRRRPTRDPVLYEMRDFVD
ncbi:MAG TPA: hypothetical protein VF593_11885 [Chthoniobacteraceae bacterium]|jgi:hypothetical protein